MAHLWMMFDSRNVALVVVGLQGGVRRERLLRAWSFVLDCVCVEKCSLLLVTLVFGAAVVVGQSRVCGWDSVFGVRLVKFLYREYAVWVGCVWYIYSWFLQRKKGSYISKCALWFRYWRAPRFLGKWRCYWPD